MKAVFLAAVLLWTAPSLHAACNGSFHDAAEASVIDAYIAYYGRPPDPGGLAYWAGQLEAAGGDLGAIMRPFGRSPEYQSRFGAYSHEALVSNLYRQLFDRVPDDDGLDHYVSQLDTGIADLETVALEVLYGATGDDLMVLDVKRQVASHVLQEYSERADAFPDIRATIFKEILNAAQYRSDAMSACTRATGFLDFYVRFASNLELPESDDDRICVQGEVPTAPGTLQHVYCFQRGPLTLDENWLTLAETFNMHAYSGSSATYVKYSATGWPLYMKQVDRRYGHWTFMEPIGCEMPRTPLGGVAGDLCDAEVTRYGIETASLFGFSGPTCTDYRAAEVEEQERHVFATLADAIDFANEQASFGALTACGRTVEECVAKGDLWQELQGISMPPSCFGAADSSR